MVNWEVSVENHSRCRAIAVLAGFLASAPGPHSAGAEDRLLAQGEAIATQKCSPCHAIGRHDARPHDIVLPFRDFHQRYPIAMLVEARKSGELSGHDEMPGFVLSASDMRALLAYIDTFAPKEKRYIKP
jgi:mono/diheme cytochrome c family protein